MDIGSYFANNGFTGASLSPSTAYGTSYSAALQNTPSLSTPSSDFSFDLLKSSTSTSFGFSLGEDTAFSTDSFLAILNDQVNRSLYDSFNALKSYQANLQQDFDSANQQISDLGYQGISTYI